jgi:hypothetical protein
MPRAVCPGYPVLLLLMLTVSVACNIALQGPSSAPTLQFRVTTPTPIAPTPPAPTSIFPTVIATTAAATGLAPILDEIESDRLMLAVHMLAGFRTRHVLSVRDSTDQGIAAARDWLIQRFAAMREFAPDKRIDVWTQPLGYAWNGFTVQTENVVAVFPGTEIGAGVIVVGAHYDSITRDWTNGTTLAPGANDNASGVAALLEIAHIMSARRHRATLMFVAFSAEETGKQGSQAFVADYVQRQGIDVRAMINLDIVGSPWGANGESNTRFARLFSAEPNDSVSRQLARQIGLIVRAYVPEADLVLQSAEERRGRWGDHQSFSAAGYPAVRLIQGLEDVNLQHSERDIPDAVDPSYMMLTTRIALAAVSVLSERLPPPSDIRLSSRAGDIQTLSLVWAPTSGAAGYVVALRQIPSLYFDQIMTIANVDKLNWTGLLNYDSVAIAAFDSQGVMGPLSAETPLRRP